jgi:hypothetical protein
MQPRMSVAQTGFINPLALEWVSETPPLRSIPKSRTETEVRFVAASENESLFWEV